MAYKERLIHTTMKTLANIVLTVIAIISFVCAVAFDEMAGLHNGTLNLLFFGPLLSSVFALIKANTDWLEV